MLPRNCIQPSKKEATTKFGIQCSKCRNEFLFELDSNKLRRWQAGEKIQNLFPELVADIRELLISGICGKCFDEMWSEQ